MRQFFFLMEAHCVPSEARNVSLYAIIQINFISQKRSTALCTRLRFSPHIAEKRAKDSPTWATDNTGLTLKQSQNIVQKGSTEAQIPGEYVLYGVHL